LGRESSRVRVFKKFRVFLESKVRASFHYFGVWILTVALRSVSLGVLVPNIFV
jgi:hypothetical protein